MKTTMKKSKTNNIENKTSVLLKFLKKTSSGSYGEIEKSSLKYSRVKETSETVGGDEPYYYSLS